MNLKLIGRILIIVIFAYFCIELFTKPTPWVLLDGANLVFHEAGHMIFLIFGQFAHMVGGSLFQVLFPCGFFVYFYLRREFFSCSAVLFWIGESLLNVSVYIKDAKDMNLPLLIEGTTHDWNWILNQWGMVEYAKIIGNSVFAIATIIIIVSFLGMIYFTLADTLEKEYK